MIFSNLPLPDPDTFVDDQFAIALPEVLAFGAALLGITITTMIVKSLAGK